MFLDNCFSLLIYLLKKFIGNSDTVKSVLWFPWLPWTHDSSRCWTIITAIVFTLETMEVVAVALKLCPLEGTGVTGYYNFHVITWCYAAQKYFFPFSYMGKELWMNEFDSLRLITWKAARSDCLIPVLAVCQTGSIRLHSNYTQTKKKSL